MKLYRDLQPGEMLQAGDERWQWPLEWAPVHPAYYGATPSAIFLLDYRRPVDLPTLQEVTPEAMAELEGRDNATIVTCDHDAAWVYRWSRKTRWTANRRPATRPTWGWFIDLSTIPEVQQWMTIL